MMNKRISIYLRNAIYDPSSYYRLCQYIQEGKSVKINNYTPGWLYLLVRKYDDKYLLRNTIFGVMFVCGTWRRFFKLLDDLFFWKPAIVVIERETFPRLIPPGLDSLYRHVLKRAKKIIWDIDDHILHDREISANEWSLLELTSSVIIMPNDYLLQSLSTVREKIIFLPTTDTSFLNIDLPYWIGERKSRYASTIDIVWTGSYGNLRFVEAILKDLEKAAENLFSIKGKKLRLKIISNIPLMDDHVRFLEIINYKWNRDLAHAQILSSHIGIMPLQDEEYARGKAGFKAIQYMGAGLPVLVSDVGYNKQLVAGNGYLISTSSQWTTALEELCKDQVMWEKYSNHSRKIFESKFNPETNKSMIGKLLDTV